MSLFSLRNGGQLGLVNEPDFGVCIWPVGGNVYCQRGLKWTTFGFIDRRPADG
jgi:hypothetical protein